MAARRPVKNSARKYLSQALRLDIMSERDRVDFASDGPRDWYHTSQARKPMQEENKYTESIFLRRSRQNKTSEKQQQAAAKGWV